MELVSAARIVVYNKLWWLWGAEDEALAGHQELFWRCLLQLVLHLILLDLLEQLLSLFACFIVVMWEQCVAGGELPCTLRFDMASALTAQQQMRY